MAGEIVFRPTRDDYVAVARGSFRRALVWRRFMVRVGIALLIVAGLGAALGLLDGGGVRPDLIGLTVAVMAAWFVLVIFTSFLLVPRRAGRLFRQQRSLDRPVGTMAAGRSAGTRGRD